LASNSVSSAASRPTLLGVVQARQHLAAFDTLAAGGVDRGDRARRMCDQLATITAELHDTDALRIIVDLRERGVRDRRGERDQLYRSFALYGGM
jgi:hypothetical protein